MVLVYVYIIAHTGPVRGVAINSINTHVYTGGSDGLIKVSDIN